MLSVLIPTLDEEDWIEHSIRSARASLRASNVDGEIIVCDGGSSDRTCRRAEQYGADEIVCTAKPGRARQWNAGAAQASGEVLALLHADSVVGPAWAGRIRGAIQEGVSGGWFQIEILPENGTVTSANGLTVMAGGINIRTLVFRTATSDQSIFVRREVFDDLGGVPSRPVMEGYELASRLGETGTTAILGSEVRISGRRWERSGLVRTMLVGFAVRAAYEFGVDAGWLSDLWQKAT
jgi:rSAM/selenodomain-associated transferase 2